MYKEDYAIDATAEVILMAIYVFRTASRQLK
jgi:hypothetical protein